MNRKSWTSRSQAQTMRLAGQFASGLKRGDVVGLVGPLGSGKTRFIKGVCKALGIPEQEVLSPTFTLLHQYDQGKIPVYHFDVYRIESDREFEDLGYEEQFFGDGITLVEWADKVEKFLPKNSPMLHFSIAGDKTRKIVLKKSRA